MDSKPPTTLSDGVAAHGLLDSRITPAPGGVGGSTRFWVGPQDATAARGGLVVRHNDRRIFGARSLRAQDLPPDGVRAPVLPVCLHPSLSMRKGEPVTRTAPRARKLDLDPATVRRARSLARAAGKPIVRLARTHTTVSVERAVLRMAGVSGADPDGIPWVNRLVDAVRDEVGLEQGVALPVWDALRRSGAADLTELAQKASTGGAGFRRPEGREAQRARTAARRDVGRGIATIDRRRRERESLVRRVGDAPRQPWI